MIFGFDEDPSDYEEYKYEPPEEFIRYLEAKGYDGFENGDNILIFNKSKLRCKIKESPDSIRLVGQKDESSWRDLLSYPFAYDDNSTMWIGKEMGWHDNNQGNFSGVISSDRKYMAGRVFGQDRTISFWFPPTKEELNQIIKDFNKVATNKKISFRIDSSWYVEMPKDEFGSYSQLVSIANYQPPAGFDGWMERLRSKVGKNFNTGDE